MNLPYLVPRVVRHFMPESITRFLMLRSVVIKPGLETVNSSAAVDRYVATLAEVGEDLQGKRILVFGYGGRFDVGIDLLEAGARYVCLSDRFAPPDDRHNAALLTQHGAFLANDRGKPRPRPKYMSLLQADIRSMANPEAGEAYDLVVSSSVLEHVEDIEGITHALARLTTPKGRHIHYVDLRDHFFKYPFEMLRFGERTWKRWLNPGSNHNRLRIWDYRRIFESNFEHTEISVLARDEDAFRKIQGRIRPEFKSGDSRDDAVTLICISATTPMV